jgi:hypothetical protein
MAKVELGDGPSSMVRAIRFLLPGAWSMMGSQLPSEQHAVTRFTALLNIPHPPVLKITTQIIFLSWAQSTDCDLGPRRRCVYSWNISLGSEAAKSRQISSVLTVDALPTIVSSNSLYFLDDQANCSLNKVLPALVRCFYALTTQYLKTANTQIGHCIAEVVVLKRQPLEITEW